MSRRFGGKSGPSSDGRGREQAGGHRPQQRSGPKHPYLYGLHTVEEALANPKRRHRALLITENALRRLQERMPVMPIAPQIVKPDEIDRLVGMDAVHQGVALDTEPLPSPHIRDLAAKGILLVLDQVTDPHNVGAIMRTAAAFGAEGVIVTERHSPEASGVLAKAASGGLEHCPLIEVVNLAQTLTELGELGFWRVGLDSEGPATLRCAGAARYARGDQEPERVECGGGGALRGTSRAEHQGLRAGGVLDQWPRARSIDLFIQTGYFLTIG